MKVVHVCNTDLGGGAGIAAYRLHRAQCARGIDSQMVVLQKKSDDPKVRKLAGNHVRVFQKLYRKLERPKETALRDETGVLWSISRLPTFNHRVINSLNPDVVHLHWVNQGTLSISEISKLKAPIVWSLHDLWPLRPGNHYTGGYDTGDERPEASRLRKRIEHSVSSAKKRAWSDLDVTWIGLSSWMSEEAAASPFREGAPVRRIWNSVPLDVYAPKDQGAARQALKLPADRPIILSGAEGAAWDPRKGADLLKKAVEAMPRWEASQGPPPLFISFGGNGEEGTFESGYEFKDLGYLSGDDTLAGLYNAADCFVCPSREDNLPNTCVEAVACGLPVIAFKVGGLADIVVEGRSGCLVEPFDTGRLASRLHDVLSAPRLIAQLDPRAVACERFCPDRQVEAFLGEAYPKS